MIVKKEHIGKKVKGELWANCKWILIEWVRDGYFSGVDSHGNAFFNKNVNGDWELYVEPEKKNKPSERINEIYLESPPQVRSTLTLHTKIDAVIQYLDEQEANK